jgi:hypothetical protein
MVWTLQRCQAAPENTRAIAALSPAWASEITRRTPLRPRSRKVRRNAVQNTSSLLSRFDPR